MRNLIENLICWLDRKINDESCLNCPYACYEQNYWDGDYDEWCGITHSSDMDVRWYCVMPNFVKKIVAKWNEYKDMKAYKEWADNNDKYCSKCNNMDANCYYSDKCLIPKERK